MRRRFAGLLLAASMVSVGLGISSVSAQSSASCTGDVVLEFTAIRLLNLEGHRTAGPFSVDLEPGVYVVTAGSFDMHGPEQLTQPQEQWQVRSDGGWSSPFTIDVPDDQQFTVTRFVQQNVTRPVSSITLEHLGQGGINSVDPTCVGFTLVSSDDDCSSSDPDATVDSDGNVTCDGSSDDSPGDPTDIAAPGTDDSSEPADPPTAPGTDDGSQPADPPAAPGTDDCADGGVAGDLVDDLNPDAADDCGDEDDPAVATPTPGDTDDGDDPGAVDPRPTPDPGDDPDAAAPAPNADPDDEDDPAVATPTPGDTDDGDDPDGAPPAPNADPDDDDDPAVATPAPGDDPDANPPAANEPDDDEVEVEVAGAVEEATELARTGTGPLTNRVFGMALVLLGLGGLTTLWSRREDFGFS